MEPTPLKPAFVTVGSCTTLLMLPWISHEEEAIVIALASTVLVKTADLESHEHNYYICGTNVPEPVCGAILIISTTK